MIPQTTAALEAAYGRIEYTDGNPPWGPGPGWVTYKKDACNLDFRDRHIVKTTLPLVGRYHVNRALKIQLHEILGRIKVNVSSRQSQNLIKQFACWAPRHKMHDPSRGLSMHAYAAAVDINWSTNAVGTGNGAMPYVIVEAFEHYGWVWGGRWAHSDPMHFQAAHAYC